MRMWAIATALLALTACAKQVALVKGQETIIAGSLEGGPWRVEDVNGGGTIPGARLDLTFEAGGSGEAGESGNPGTGRVAGRSGCNRFAGAWQQTGATIKLGPISGTRMMCAPAMMELEAKFLAALAAAVNVRFDTTGAAFLESADGRVIKLRREAG